MATNSGIVRLWEQFGELFKLVDTITVVSIDGAWYRHNSTVVDPDYTPNEHAKLCEPGDYNLLNDRKLVLVDAPFWRAGTMPGTWKMEAN